MPMLTCIKPFYAALPGLVSFALSVRTLRLRGWLRIPVGDGGNEHMLRAMRVHANFAEYAPLSLLLILMFELRCRQQITFTSSIGPDSIAGWTTMNRALPRSSRRFEA
jgi:uncharacterized membrane protein YecN with MAPEG domain